MNSRLDRASVIGLSVYQSIALSVLQKRRRLSLPAAGSYPRVG